jgi:hypothetical protein
MGQTMTKVGLITAGITFILALGITLLSPLCLPCIAVLAGLVTGYLAGVVDRPPARKLVSGPGAISGLFAGLGMLLGQLAGSALNTALVGPKGAADLLKQLGTPAGAGTETGYYIGVIASVCCIGLLNIGLAAGLGALGSLLWWEITGKNNPAPPISF